MNRIKHFAFVFYIVACPIAWRTSAGSMREFQEGFWQLMAMSFIVLFAKNVWLTSFFLWNVFLFCLGGAVIGKAYTYNIFIAIILFMVCRRYFRSFLSEQEFKPLIWVAVLTITWMIMQFLLIDPMYVLSDGSGRATDSSADWTGLFGLKAAQAIFLATIIPVISAVNPIAALVLFIPIFHCYSVGAILAGVSSYIFYTFFLHKKICSLVCVLGVIGVGLYMVKDYRQDSQMFTSRFHVWHLGIRDSLRRPWGYGPDSWRNLLKHKNFIYIGDQDRNLYRAVHVSGDDFKYQYYHPNPRARVEGVQKRIRSSNWWDNAHNELIQLLFEYGVVGVAIFIGLLREMHFRFKYSVKSKELVMISACLVAFLAASTTHFPFHLARLGFFIPLLLGAFYAVTDVREHREAYVTSR